MKKSILSIKDIIRDNHQISITSRLIEGNDPFPNNDHLPLLVYHQALVEHDDQNIKELLGTNKWSDSWVDGIYNYHHFHSTAHEVLAVLKGFADVQFGGPNGATIRFMQGDVILIPAGVSHMCKSSGDDFHVIGAYPEGQKYDIMKGNPDQLNEARHNIGQVPLPALDPLYGADGPVLKLWSR